MRTKHLFATLVVAVVAAASLGVAVALNAPEVADRTTASTGGDAGPGTGARAGGDPPAGTVAGRQARPAARPPPRAPAGPATMTSSGS
jgi:hypothetical protein